MGGNRKEGSGGLPRAGGKVSTVMTVLNTQAAGEVLRVLPRQTYPVKEIEFIVPDGGSKKGVLVKNAERTTKRLMKEKYSNVKVRKFIRSKRAF